MNMTHSPRKLALILLSLALIGGAAWYLSQTRPSTSAVGGYALPSTETPESDSVAIREGATLSGSLECIPFADPEALQGEECVRGIRTAEGLYYVVDFALSPETQPSLSMGEKITALGILTPVELLSTDTWRKYPISGIFQVTETVSAAGASSNTNLEARVGEGLKVGDMVLTVLSVEDSRCPSDVQCFWAGKVVALVQIASGSSTSMTSMEPSMTIAIPGYELSLVSVMPYPKASSSLSQSDYQLSFVLSPR